MTQDQSRNSIRNGKTVERIKKLSAVIAEMEETVHTIRHWETAFDHMRPVMQEEGFDPELQVIDNETRNKLVSWADTGFRSILAEKYSQLGRLVVDAGRHGVDTIKLEIDPEYMWVDAREEYLKRKAGETVSVTHAEITDVIKDLRDKVKDDLSNTRGGKTHGKLRLEGANNALDALVIMLEDRGLL